MNFRTLSTGCPNRIFVNTGEVRIHCKALVNQPNGSYCTAGNCAALHIADLLVNELRAEVMTLLEGRNEQKAAELGGTNEHTESFKTSPARDKG